MSIIDTTLAFTIPASKSLTDHCCHFHCIFISHLCKWFLYSAVLYFLLPYTCFMVHNFVF